MDSLVSVSHQDLSWKTSSCWPGPSSPADRVWRAGPAWIGRAEGQPGGSGRTGKNQVFERRGQGVNMWPLPVMRSKWELRHHFSPDPPLPLDGRGQISQVYLMENSNTLCHVCRAGLTTSVLACLVSGRTS